ncbi:MAG TPA: S41 family peptidase [Pyrinomonadaceae bacterium]|nr:S41 family peptidase [Pyrinomonadaceae bacterium]
MKKLILCFAVAAFPCASFAQSDAAMHQKVFEAVWSTVNSKFYDPNFNGVDWKAAHDKYAPLAKAAKTDDELYATIKEMLGLIKVSHLQAGSAAATAKRFKSQPGAIGIGVRNIEGRITVFRSLKEFPAFKGGIRPGFVITAVDGIKAVDVEAASKAIAGSPGTTVKVRYLDENDAEHEVTLERQGLTDKGKIEGLSIYALFDSKRLEGGVGYISFSSFVPFLNDRIAAAFDSMKDAPAIILDLRGNSGGDDSVSLKIEQRLFKKETQLMLIKTRKGINRDVKATGNASSYLGKIVILVDEFSGSAAEEMTAGLQEAGRAYVIGRTTMGEDLDADIQELPDGGILIYPFGQSTTPKGVIIEGRGVIPDQTVELKRADLLAGRDTQLQAALEYLKKN